LRGSTRDSARGAMTVRVARSTTEQQRARATGRALASDGGGRKRDSGCRTRRRRRTSPGIRRARPLTSRRPCRESSRRTRALDRVHTRVSTVRATVPGSADREQRPARAPAKLDLNAPFFLSGQPRIAQRREAPASRARSHRDSKAMPWCLTGLSRSRPGPHTKRGQEEPVVQSPFHRRKIRRTERRRGREEAGRRAGR